jgi:hypothetical protein
VRPLDSKERAAAFRTSIGVCVIALALFPLASPMEFKAEAGSMLPVLARPQPNVEPAGKVKDAKIERDPFVPDAASLPIVRIASSGDEGAMTLPLNDGASADAAGALPPSVRAVVLGATPHALLRVGDSSRIVGVGDLVEGSRIVQIGASGLRLESGETLPLEKLK